MPDAGSTPARYDTIADWYAEWMEGENHSSRKDGRTNDLIEFSDTLTLGCIERHSRWTNL